MKVIVAAVFIISLFNIPQLYAQQSQDLEGFSKIKLREGFPTLYSGKKVAFKFKDPKYGAINSGNAFLGSYILIDNSSPDEPRFWYMLVKKDSTFSLKSFSFSSQHTNLSTIKMNLKNSTNAKYTYPLTLAYKEDENQFYYRWLGSQNQNSPQRAKNNSKLIEGKHMPTFTVQLVNGKKWDMKAHNNKIVVINWWSTTCAPCIAEIPGFNKLVKKYKSNNQIIFLAIAWNTQQEVKSFLKTQSFNYKQALYNDQTIKLFRGAFPRNIVVNRNGTIIYNQLGALNNQWKEVDQAIRKQLNNR